MTRPLPHVLADLERADGCELRRRRRASLVVGATTLLLAATTTACGSGTLRPTTGPVRSEPSVIGAAQPPTTTTGPSAPAVGSFTKDNTAMQALRSIVPQGTGKITVLLSGAPSIVRDPALDGPALANAFRAAGLTADQFTVETANGDPTVQQRQAEAALGDGTTVLVLQSRDDTVGPAIEKAAAAKGIAIIDLDHLVKGGAADRTFVGFDDAEAGRQMGTALIRCAADWKVTAARTVLLDSDQTIDGAPLTRYGYTTTLAPTFADGTFTQVDQPAGTDDPRGVQDTLDSYRANGQTVTAVVAGDDTIANIVVNSLRATGTAPNTVPVVGRGAGLSALQNVLLGYQCGTAYEPAYLEAQVVATLAVRARAQQDAPASLVTAVVHDPGSNDPIGAVVLAPTWVTATNIAATVLTDHTVTAAQLCNGDAAAACAAAAIG